MTRKSPLLVLPLLAAQILFLYLLSYAITSFAGFPGDLGLPWALRLLGIPFVAYGIGMAAWVFRFRGPRAMLESTYVTGRKLLRRQPLAVVTGRTEPLVVAGPYRLVRHPLYSGIDAATLGIALLVDHPWAYLGAFFFWIWFALVLAPFEERELVALFGAPYREYMRTHPRFLPLPRRPR